MKKIISGITAASMITAAVQIQIPCVSSAKDSIIDYTESVETIENPAAGYSSTVWANCKPGKTPVYNPTGSLMLFFIDIGGFSCGVNGTKNDDGTYTEGTDYDFDDTFFQAWDETLQNCRNNGCMVALRFRYDSNGKDNPEPASFEQVLHHIEQLKNSGLFEKYADILAFVECGFVGKWGEQHGGKYTSIQYKAQLLEAMLDAVPAPIPVTVRTPDIFAEWAGIKRSELNNVELIDSLTESKYTDDIQSNRSRIGMFDDGYMGSNSDLGTYSDRAVETDWLSRQTLTSYFGGEFSGNIEFAKQYDTYLPENAVPEMYKTHLSYINCNIFQLYKDFTFSEEYDVENVDNSAYYGQSVFKFIRDHIGYRFVLRNSEVTESTSQGDSITVDFDVENTGFAGVIPDVQSYVVLEKDGIFAFAEADIDCRNWLSCTLNQETIDIKLPDSLPAGEWNVYLKLSMGTPLSVSNMNGRSIRFANDGVWESSLGANLLGSVSVTESPEKGTDNTLKASDNSDDMPYQLYSSAGGTVVDGAVSSPYEWTDDMLLYTGENGISVYAKADDQYLYVMSDIPKNGAVSPVYNLQFMNGADGDRYWIYYQSGGFVYFNHGDYNGSQCKWGEDMVEYRLPLDKMGLTQGTEITNLRVFMQDSGNEWKLMSDITAPEYTVPSDFVVISAETDICLNEGDSYKYTVITELEDGAEYEWYCNGEILKDFNSAEIYLENLTDKDSGDYTVRIKSVSGVEKTVTAFRLEVIGNRQDNLYGDANCDGEVSVADATLILQYCGNKDKYSLEEQGKINADVDGTAGISAVDALVIQQVDAGVYSSDELPLKK
ncbi:MAG: DUF4832 domain-containing protein [Ruminococcus sp.]|nr:DUF4832 domain-containing protein [Ruminococcus sp.]